jgi:hypothetical protein
VFNVLELTTTLVTFGAGPSVKYVLGGSGDALIGPSCCSSSKTSARKYGW